MTLSMALSLLPGLVIGLSLHEFAHAFSASLLGDDFPRRQRRVSLNPFRHLSLLGTLAIFVLPFGWAKPVRVNLYNFRRPKRDYLLSSLAGPAANVLVVALCFALMQLTRRSYLFGPAPALLMEIGHYSLLLVALINAILATVNLLPIPPLDGSKIWPVLIPSLKPDFGGKSSRLFIILLVILLWTGAIEPVFGFVLGTVADAAPTTDGARFVRLAERGHLAYEREQYDRAVEQYTAALHINRWSAETWISRAYAHAGREDWPAALADLDATIKLRPATYQALEFRADVLDWLGRGDEAARDRRAAASLRKELGLPPATSATAPATASAPAGG